MIETPQFPPSEIPTRLGVYGVEHPITCAPGYAYWNGYRWGLWCVIPEAADKCRAVASSFRTMRWWGLTLRGWKYEAAKIRREETAEALNCPGT